MLALALNVFGQTSAPEDAIKVQQEHLKTAGEAKKGGRKQEAIATYQAIIDHQVANDGDIRAEAVRGLLPARYAVASGFFLAASWATEWIPPWFRWIVISSVALGLWCLIVRLGLRRGVCIAFEDLSANRETRLNRSRVLTGLMVELLTPRQLSDGEFSMDIMPGTGEPGFSGVMPDLKRDMSTRYEADEHPVKIGSVEFVPSELFRFFSWLLPKTEESIEGWLECRGEEATVSANYIRRGRLRRSERKQWLFRHVGPNSEDEVLSLLAAQIIVDLRKVDFTRNGRSYRELRAALQTSLLDQEGLSGAVPNTREHLEAAVNFDPKNWIARFSLALELCKSGSPGEAIKQFELLESLLKKVLYSQSDFSSETNLSPASGRLCPRDSEAFIALQEHLAKYPACPFLVFYNKAIALAACDSPKEHEEALQILGDLAELNPSSNSAFPLGRAAAMLNRRAALELKLNALSARANLIAMQAWRRGEFTNRESNEVKDLLDQIEELCLSEQDRHWRSFQTARAVAHAAHGRSLLSGGQGHEALSVFQTALAAQPTFAGARMLAAEAYMAFQKAFGSDWSIHARNQLLLALRIAGNCKQTQSLLAALYSSEALGQTSDAELLYRKLGELPVSSLWLGQFILNTNARGCPALFAVHQYISASAGVVPSCRQRLEDSVADFGVPNSDCGSNSEAAKLLLSGIESAGVALPSGLLAVCRRHLGSGESVLKAAV